jgi:hypothetical protein
MMPVGQAQTWPLIANRFLGGLAVRFPVDVYMLVWVVALFGCCETLVDSRSFLPRLSFFKDSEAAVCIPSSHHSDDHSCSRHNTSRPPALLHAMPHSVQ